MSSSFKKAGACSTERLISFLSEELPYIWRDAYLLMTPRAKYCVLHPAIPCLSRPLYVDGTAKPAFVEFGILKSNGKLWVQCFDNR